MTATTSDKPMSQDGRIDPTKVDVAAKPKRRRRKRNMPAPPAELTQWGVAAEKRARARPYPPNIMLKPAGFDKEHWTSPHADTDLWMLQLADAFGTRSQAVISTFLSQIEALCDGKFWDDGAHQWRLDESEFSAALALINALKPKNEMEAALAAQMVAIHLLTMKVTARAIRYEYDTRTAAVAGKLARTFTLQMETLQTLRGKQRTTQQSIKVTKELHQHVHYHGHRGEGETSGQPHGRGDAVIDQRTALPSPQPGGQALSLSRCKGKAGLPNARRR